MKIGAEVWSAALPESMVMWVNLFSHQIHIRKLSYPKAIGQTRHFRPIKVTTKRKGSDPILAQIVMKWNEVSINASYTDVWRSDLLTLCCIRYLSDINIAVRVGISHSQNLFMLGVSYIEHTILWRYRHEIPIWSRGSTENRKQKQLEGGCTTWLQTLITPDSFIESGS